MSQEMMLLVMSKETLHIKYIITLTLNPLNKESMTY